MNSPTLYVDGNQLQRDTTARLLPELLQHLPDSYSHHRLLDIGCGTGDVLTDILLPSIPRSESVLGVDLSENMVEYCREKYASDDRLRFKCADIESPEIVAEIGETFHTIFSFNVFHYVHEQKQALKNIHDLLQPGGYAVLLFPGGRAPSERMYELLSKRPQWSNAMKDWQKFVSPYREHDEPDKALSQVAREAGLEACHVKMIWDKFTHASVDTFARFLHGFNPFYDRIPEEDRAEFLRQSTGELLKLMPPNHNGTVSMHFRMLVAVLRRPGRVSEKCR